MEGTSRAGATPEIRPRPGVSLRRKLAVLAVSAVVLVLGAEWGLRYFNIERLSHTNPELYVPDPDPVLRFRMKPNVRVYSHGCWWETNEDGLRGQHWDDAHAAGKECVLFFGHSIAGGFGVKNEEAFPALFTELNGRNLAGINMGISGYKYHQEIPLALSFRDEIRPVASVVMFTGNDFEEPMKPFEVAVDGKGDAAGQLPLPGKRWLRRHSVVYNYLRKSWSRLLVVLGVRTIPPTIDYALLHGDSEESLARFADFEEHVVRLQEETGGALVLTAFPMGQCEYSYGRIRALAERLGAVYVDLSDLWTDEADYMRRGSLGWGTHPSAATHRILAERFTPAVLEALDAASD